MHSHTLHINPIQHSCKDFELKWLIYYTVSGLVWDHRSSRIHNCYIVDRPLGDPCQVISCSVYIQPPPPRSPLFAWDQGLHSSIFGASSLAVVTSVTSRVFRIGHNGCMSDMFMPYFIRIIHRLRMSYKLDAHLPLLCSLGSAELD